MYPRMLHRVALMQLNVRRTYLKNEWREGQNKSHRFPGTASRRNAQNWLVRARTFSMTQSLKNQTARMRVWTATLQIIPMKLRSIDLQNSTSCVHMYHTEVKT